MKIRKKLRNIFLKIILSYFLLTVFCLITLRWVNPKTSMFMMFAKIEAKQKEQKLKLRFSWIDFKRISPCASLAVIAAEDQKFLQHHGFDMEAMKEAHQDYLSNKRVRGSSTISQQVAKNLFLWKDKNWFRKGVEVYYTFLLELFLSKQRILEIYLNIAEFGKGIFGIKEASGIFFQKIPGNLNSAECALLAAVLPNPKRLKVNAPSKYVRERQLWIMKQMRQLGGSSLVDFYQ